MYSKITRTIASTFSIGAMERESISKNCVNFGCYWQFGKNYRKGHFST
jgi:hypothetical protein